MKSNRTVLPFGVSVLPAMDGRIDHVATPLPGGYAVTDAEVQLSIDSEAGIVAQLLPGIVGVV